MIDLTEYYLVLELGYIIPKWEVLCDSGGGKPSDGFILNINVDE